MGVLWGRRVRLAYRPAASAMTRTASRPPATSGNGRRRYGGSFGVGEPWGEVSSPDAELAGAGAAPRLAPSCGCGASWSTATRRRPEPTAPNARGCKRTRSRVYARSSTTGAVTPSVTRTRKASRETGKASREHAEASRRVVSVTQASFSVTKRTKVRVPQGLRSARSLSIVRRGSRSQRALPRDDGSVLVDVMASKATIGDVKALGQTALRISQLNAELNQGTHREHLGPNRIKSNAVDTAGGRRLWSSGRRWRNWRRCRL